MVARAVTDSVRTIYAAPWRVDVSVRHGVSPPLSAAAIARTAARALDAGGAPSPASIALILADNTELSELNATHMGEQGATDVLSFPLLPAAAFPPHPGRNEAFNAERPPLFVLPPGQRQHLGDVVISVEQAAEQAKSGKGGQTSDVTWSMADELRLLVIHGVLHICGWDHAATDERNAMRELESELMDER